VRWSEPETSIPRKTFSARPAEKSYYNGYSLCSCMRDCDAPQLEVANVPPTCTFGGQHPDLNASLASAVQLALSWPVTGSRARGRQRARSAGNHRKSGRNFAGERKRSQQPARKQAIEVRGES
jgi:hypothetical protein